MLGPERFSSRVEDYVRYRPGYPRQVLDLLGDECGLDTSWEVADIGAGPGNLSRLFLDNGNPVFAVEPNPEMRDAGRSLLGERPNFISINGSAESTTLASASVDLIVAGQAFHWFNQAEAKEEFRRIAKPRAWIALIWNMRRVDDSSFSQAYETILRSIPEYAEVKADRAPLDELREFFSPNPLAQGTLFNEQVLDRKSFLGRVLSSSYVPQFGSEGHEEVVNSLNLLFDAEHTLEEIRFVYDTQVYYGQVR